MVENDESNKEKNKKNLRNYNITQRGFLSRSNISSNLNCTRQLYY